MEGTEHGGSLKEMASIIRPGRDQQGSPEPQGEHLGRWALIGAIVAAIIGLGVAWILWRLARKPLELEPPLSAAEVD